MPENRGAAAADDVDLGQDIADDLVDFGIPLPPAEAEEGAVDADDARRQITRYVPPPEEDDACE